MGVLMAVIVGATMLGLVYLTQTLGSAATGTEIYLTEKASIRTLTDTRTLQTEILKQTGIDAIAPKARKFKLKQLAEPIVLPAP